MTEAILKVQTRTPSMLLLQERRAWLARVCTLQEGQYEQD